MEAPFAGSFWRQGSDHNTFGFRSSEQGLWFLRVILGFELGVRTFELLVLWAWEFGAISGVDKLLGGGGGGGGRAGGRVGVTI